MADRIGVMSPQGELLQLGAPGEIYERPNCRYTAEFVGETNMLSGREPAARRLRMTPATCWINSA